LSQINRGGRLKRPPSYAPGPVTPHSIAGGNNDLYSTLADERLLLYARLQEQSGIFDTADTKKAKEFATSSDLKDVMTKAGVIEVLTMYFLESM